MDRLHFRNPFGYASRGEMNGNNQSQSLLRVSKCLLFVNWYREEEHHSYSSYRFIPRHENQI